MQRSKKAAASYKDLYWHSHVSLSLDDGVHILRVDHAQHPVAENARCCGFHHDEDQDGKKAANKTFIQTFTLGSSKK